MTNNVGFPTLATNDVGKETIINSMCGRLDAALTDYSEVVIVNGTGTYNITLTAAKTCVYMKLVNGSPVRTTTFFVNFPLTVRKLLIIENATGQTATIQVGTVTQFNVTAGNKQIIYFNDTLAVAV